MKTRMNQIRIRIESYSYKSLVFAQKHIINTLKISSKIFYISLVSLPIKKKIYCVLRSPHVDKDSREHFEIRTHKKILDIYYDPELVILDFLNFIDSNLSSEVSFCVKY
uniref:Ribosomal protein S10 n=1 Tax=Nitzschia sp. NIES-3576 TaxID=2083273 RepID=A0A2Z5ZBA4_9STRA|nr:ribosomal protein S10 [Nitzschia sp. NIES-3576]BBC77663.1 ribosomal protein S10 [Nitzschia sp. NIES-3576]